MKFLAGLIIYATFCLLGTTAGLWVLGCDWWRMGAAAVCIIIGAGWPLALVLVGANSEQRPAKK